MVSAIMVIVMAVSGGSINIPVNAAAHFLAFQDENRLKFLAKKEQAALLRQPVIQTTT